MFNWLFAGTTIVLAVALAVFARDGSKRAAVDAADEGGDAAAGDDLGEGLLGDAA